MCSIFGLIATNAFKHIANPEVKTLIRNSIIRGRDGLGFVSISPDGSQHCRKYATLDEYEAPGQSRHLVKMLIGNARAEPTTEWVEHKSRSDQQPYFAGEWAIVHNGTIANDKELRTFTVDTDIDSAAIAEYLESINARTLTGLLEVIKGSYAILAIHIPTNTFHIACNYRPIWMSRVEDTIYFGSTRNLPRGEIGSAPEMVAPYSYLTLNEYGKIIGNETLYKPSNGKTLVVCSAGLDSTVAASVCINRGDDVTLLHFQYGSKAEDHELSAIHVIAQALKVPCVVKSIPIYNKNDSNLLNPACEIAGGEEGAEFAHEWVPARNTVLLAIAIAYAEANGFDTIVLGNNLEEAGAYPDNEPEFIDRFNDMLPFCVGDGKRMQIEMPVGNLMKHEIVKLGVEVKAPMHLTWSCYKNGPIHCGRCGPCFMRRKAFEINNIPEVIQYASVN